MVGAVSFARYAALVKNLRGVVASYGDDEAKETVKWLSRRFRYRDLGVTPYALEAYRSLVEPFLGGKPLRELSYPAEALRLLSEKMAEALSSRELAEAAVLASAYVSPLLLASSSLAETAEQLGVATVRFSGELDVNSWKLHLRIADYTVLDMYSICVEEALDAIRSARVGDEARVEAILRRRAERVSKDAKRYWRIAAEKGKPFLTYVDLLRVAHVAGILGDLDEDAAAGLAVVPAVHVYLAPQGKKSQKSS
ncbi:MAG: hypothetical protein ABWW70_00210 [Thermoproteota archaeon]